LVDRHRVRLGTRSLDLMHVATALLMKAEMFPSFDRCQRRAAESEGLRIPTSETPRKRRTNENNG
jgi:hypothetical protein